jgi:ATP-binding cassette subfamily B protein
MRHRFGSDEGAPGPHADWRTLRELFPYLLAYKGRIALAMLLLVAAKLSVVSIPLLLKDIVDSLDHPPAVLVVPAALIVAYGLLRLASTLFGDLRDIVFARVTQRAIREMGRTVFEHLHALSLRFHLARQTGGVARDMERGARGVAGLVNFTLFSILPTLLEISLVAGLLWIKVDGVFAAITVAVLLLYIGSTIWITNWRTRIRREMNELDSRASSRAIDSLLNYETVKYFGNEGFESRRYDAALGQWEQAAIRTQTSLGLLNVVQASVIALGITFMLMRAADGVVAGRLTLGDLVMVNAFLIQMFIPLNFLGVMYREIKQSLTDIERLFGLLHTHREVLDAPDAPPLHVRGAEVVFTDVHFAYEPDRAILRGVSFRIPAGRTVAVVGASGAGKSTLSRLLFRFYDVQHGSVSIDGQDVRHVSQDSLRTALGIVPQDTVLFNDSIRYNIAYGRPEASEAELQAAARAAHILGFIEALPQGWETLVGERGLKLSGGEKQRVAIARTLLKNPPILVLDEATSALDSKTERIIQAELRDIARERTTLVIAHRLSTIVDADEILVMEAGEIIERGTHAGLLARDGVYARMWALQQTDEPGA